MQPVWIEFKSHVDNRGTLVVMEGGRDLPFEVRRVYTMFGLHPKAVRGAHAHRQQKQVIQCLAGSCRLTLDDGHEPITVRLDEPARGLLLAPQVWHELRDFSADCVLLVTADGHFDPADVVTDRAEFLALAEARERPRESHT